MSVSDDTKEVGRIERGHPGLGMSLCPRTCHLYRVLWYMLDLYLGEMAWAKKLWMSKAMALIFTFWTLKPPSTVSLYINISSGFRSVSWYSHPFTELVMAELSPNLKSKQEALYQSLDRQNVFKLQGLDVIGMNLPAFQLLS